MSILRPRPFPAHHRATVTCQCGARLDVYALTAYEAGQQVRDFNRAHAGCRSAPKVTPTTEQSS